MKEQGLEGKKNGIAEFVGETRQEINKVTWPTRSETIKTTVIVVLMALAAGVFFLVVDSAVGFAIGRILGMNS